MGRPLPGWDINPAPLYRLPFPVVFINTLTAAILGAAAGFLDAWLEIGRTRVGGLGLVVSKDPYSLKLAAEAGYTIKSASLKFLHDCDEMMDAARAGETLTQERRAELRYNTVRSAQLAARAVERLFEAGGGHSIFRRPSASAPLPGHQGDDGSRRHEPQSGREAVRRGSIGSPGLRPVSLIAAGFIRLGRADA